MNVRINLAGLKDEEAKSSLQEKMRRIAGESEAEFKRVHALVESKLG